MLAKIKELTKDTAVYGISTMIGRFLGFLLVPYYTNLIPAGDFGIYSNIYAYLAFLNIVYIYGMDAAFMKYASVEKSSIRRIFSTSYLTMVVTSVTFTFILYLVKSPIIDITRLGTDHSQIYYFVLAILFLDSLSIIPFAHLRLARRTKKFAFIKISNITINLLLNIYFISFLKMGIEGIFIANAIASLFSLVALLPDILTHIEFSINTNYLKRILKFGIPYLPASMAAMIVQVIDRPLVLAMKGKVMLGIYSANYKLGIFMMLFVSMFQYAWQPFFLNNANEKDAKKIFSKVLTLFLTVAAMLWIFVSVYIDDFAKIEILHGRYLVGKGYWGGLYIVPIILLAYIFHGMYVNFQAGIYIEEKTKYFPYITFSGATVNVVVNILVIPVWGIFGAALATLASYITMSMVSYYFSHKYYPINYEYGKIFTIIGLLTASIISYYVLYDLQLLTFVNKTILFIAFTFSLFLLRVIKISDFISTFKMFKS